MHRQPISEGVRHKYLIPNAGTLAHQETIGVPEGSELLVLELMPNLMTGA
jgi:hypothetical protein